MAESRFPTAAESYLPPGRNTKNWNERIQGIGWHEGNEYKIFIWLMTKLDLSAIENFG